MNGLHRHSAALTGGRSERCTTPPHTHPFIHTSPESAPQGDSQLVRSSQCWGACSGTPPHSGDRTSNPPVTGRPSLPRRPHAADMLDPRETRGSSPSGGSGVHPREDWGSMANDRLDPRETRDSSPSGGSGVHPREDWGSMANDGLCDIINKLNRQTNRR